MPHFLTLCRIQEVSNDEGLRLNKELARILIARFPEISALNKLDLIKLKLDDEYPEAHFQLECETEKLGFLINFWKQEVIMEISWGFDLNSLFEAIECYSNVIMNYGFLIDDPEKDEMLDLDKGIRRHKSAYIDFGRQVNIVKKIIESEEGKNKDE